MFLNCTVRTVDEIPLVGVPIHSFYLGDSAIVYYGYSDSTGQVRLWYRPDTSDHRQYPIICPPGSRWRLSFEVPDHPFPGISVDLHVPFNGTTDANANVTLTIAPSTIALSNGSFEEISRRNGIYPDSPLSGPYLLSRRNSSSLSNISDISSFSLASDHHGVDVVSMSEVRSIASPPQYPTQSPIGRTEAGDSGVETCFDAQTSVGEDDSCSTNKRKHDEHDSFDESAPMKRARSSRE